MPWLKCNTCVNCDTTVSDSRTALRAIHSCHTFITQSLNANVSARDVQAAAGHKDGRMVAYYDHGSQNRGREATHALTAYIAEMT